MVNGQRIKINTARQDVFQVCTVLFIVCYVGLGSSSGLVIKEKDSQPHDHRLILVKTYTCHWWHQKEHVPKSLQYYRKIYVLQQCFVCNCNYN